MVSTKIIELWIAVAKLSQPVLKKTLFPFLLKNIKLFCAMLLHTKMNKPQPAINEEIEMKQLNE